MKLDSTTFGPDEPIRIQGDYSDSVRVELVGQPATRDEEPVVIPLRIDQIQEGYIIAWTPLHADYTSGRLELVVTDDKVEEREPLTLTEYVEPVVVEAEPASFLSLTAAKDSYQLDWKPREGSEGVELTLMDDRGTKQTIVMKTSGEIGKGDLGKRVDAEQRLTLETKAGLRVKDGLTKLDDVSLKGNGWKVVGIREL